MYIVMEIQRSGEDVLNTLVSTYTTRNEAESKYHQILTSAAISQVEQHSAVLLSETGYNIKQESYDHRVIVE